MATHRLRARTRRLRPLTLAERAAQRRPDTAAGRDELNQLNRYARPYQDAPRRRSPDCGAVNPINQFVRNARDQHDYLTGEVNRLETAAAGLYRNVAAAQGVATPNFDEERNNTTRTIRPSLSTDTSDPTPPRSICCTGAERGELVEIHHTGPAAHRPSHCTRVRTVVTDTHPYTGTGFARTIPLPVDDDVMQRARTEMGEARTPRSSPTPTPTPTPAWIRPPVGGQGQPGGGLGGWSSQPGADAIPARHSASRLGVKGRRATGARGGRAAAYPPRAGSSTGLTSAGRGVRWPDGRRMEVLFRNHFLHGLWQRLRQAAVSGGPGRSGAVGIGGFAGRPMRQPRRGGRTRCRVRWGRLLRCFGRVGLLVGCGCLVGVGCARVGGVGAGWGLMDRLVVPAGTVVVHGTGVGGGLGSPAGVAEALGVARTGGWGRRARRCRRCCWRVSRPGRRRLRRSRDSEGGGDAGVGVCQSA